jgi:hypothetical protein
MAFCAKVQCALPADISIRGFSAGTKQDALSTDVCTTVARECREILIASEDAGVEELALDVGFGLVNMI